MWLILLKLLCFGVVCRLQGQAANYFRAGFNSLTSPYRCEKNRLTEDDLRFNLARKKFLAAWAANNRDLTAGAKERFSIVQRLVQSGLKLDIFGKSGKKPKFMNSNQFYDTMSEFKFYFAFENGYHCQEYITEKVWFNSFYLGSVPIVWDQPRLTQVECCHRTLIYTTKTFQILWN